MRLAFLNHCPVRAKCSRGAQEEQVEALAQLSAVMQFGWSVNRALRFEVFIHKVDCLQDDQKREVQREIHRRVLDQCLQSFEPERIAQLNNLIRCASAATSDPPAAPPLAQLRTSPPGLFPSCLPLPLTQPIQTHARLTLLWILLRFTNARLPPTVTVTYLLVLFQMCLRRHHVNTNHMICNVEHVVRGYS